MRKTVVLVGAVALCVLWGTAEARGQEQEISQDKISKVVMNALLARFPKAQIDKAIKAKEDNDIIYDIEFTQDGRKCEADIKENGTYINYEKAIAASSLPAAVRAAIDKRYPKATLKEVMEETEVKGKVETLSAYEVVLMTADQKEVEVRLSPAGKILEEGGSPEE